MAESLHSFCYKCGFSLKSSFEYCPKCGIKVRMTSSSTSTSVSPSHETIPGPTKFSLPNFKKFKAMKESERDSFFVRGKGVSKGKKKEDEIVTINIGVMKDNNSIIRGGSLPLKIVSTARAPDILEAALKKHQLFNARFESSVEYMLVFKDGSEVKYIPGTEKEPFSLKRYKEESGFGFARITLFLLPVGDVFEEIRKSLDEDTFSVSSEDDDDDLEKPAFEKTNRSVSSPTVASLVPSTSATMSEKDDPPKTNQRRGLFIDCPTCWARFPVNEIEQHADICAQSLEVFADPHPNATSCPETADIDKEQEHNLKDEIMKLEKCIKGESIRVTVRRKQLWSDFARAHDHYSPTQPLKITFCGEPAIDDGGPKREFFCEMLEYCKRRLFTEGNPLNSVIALSKEDFRRAGEIMAMSIVQGGPGPNFLSPEVYTVLSRSFMVEDCKDAFLKETCLKLQNASNEELVDLLLNDEILEILQTIGYNGVPSKENKDTVHGIIQSICMYDQTPKGSMPSILQLEEGLKTYDLLYAVRKNPDMWRPVFTPAVTSELTASSISGQLAFNYSLPQILKEKEIDLHFHFSNYLHSLDTAGLEAFLKWGTGSSSIPPLGLPRKIKIQFLHGCRVGCCCRPTSSTCDLCITIPSHLDNDNAMKSIFASAIGDSAGFGMM